MRIIIRKEEELDILLNEQNNDIEVTTGTKNMHQETKETQNCNLIYSGANEKAQSQAGLMFWIHNSLRNKIVHYIYWNERILQAILERRRGNLKILFLHDPEEGREEDNEEFYKQLQEILINLTRMTT